ncbi:Rz lytic protein [Pantoea agglomerans]|nr:Rz lytic protein [Pantoea agglomerans]WIL43098.1 Rz lytic protein [Pantoea agglomerans]
MAAFQFIKNYSHIFVIGLICLALWMLNARSSQLEATNQRLEKQANSKDEQINDLRSKNDGLASSVTELVTAVKQQNDVMSQVAEQRAVTAQQNRKLQNEIKRYLAADKNAAATVPADAVKRLRDAAKSVNRVQDNQAAPSKSASGIDQPDKGTGTR